MHKHKFNCPECNNVMIVYNYKAGETVKCNSCSKIIKIPGDAELTVDMSENKKKVESANNNKNLRKYPALKTISVALSVIYGILITSGSFGILYGLSLLAEKYPDISPVLVIPLSIGFILFGIISKAFSELVILFVNIANDVEELKKKSQF